MLVWTKVVESSWWGGEKETPGTCHEIQRVCTSKWLSDFDILILGAMLSYSFATLSTETPIIKFCEQQLVISPLMPELNPSAQRSFPDLLLGILIFKALIARRTYKSFGVKGLSM
jgi:hypothetical protein